MPSTLLVPIHLDALRLTAPLTVADPGPDFSDLPYFDGRADVNPGTPYLGESVTDLPFENRELRLGAGVHLHWALPDALTHRREDEFPPVPDRWMVARSDLRGVVQEQWVVESDYLYPPGHPGSPMSIAWPTPLDRLAPGDPPFRRCGRRLPFGVWASGLAAAPPAEYLPGPLTALGFGSPTFAAMYPTCRSVFGMYDDAPGAGGGVRYEVVGWYSKPALDPLRRLRERVRAARPDATEADLLAAMRDELDWAADGATALPDGIACYARVDLAAPAPAAQAEPGPVAVSVGNTGVEALSAYLASSLAPAHRTRVEHQLEAVQMTQRLERHAAADAPAKFREGRHAKGFTAVDAGSLWSVLPRRASGAAGADAAQAGMGLALPARVADPLNRVNRLQREYDRGSDDLDGLRRRLFADWCRYQLCAHVPSGSTDPLPDPDEVRDYIERRALPRLEEARAALGTLTLLEDAEGRSVTGATATGPDSVAERLAEALGELFKRVEELNRLPATVAAKTGYALARSAAPRFWMPAEPVVLVAGPGTEPSLRHGSDGRLRDDGLLGCWPVAGVAPSGVARGAMEAVRKRLENDVDGPPNSRISVTVGDGRPWNPLLLEWEAELFPLRDPYGSTPYGAAYPADHVTRSFTLPGNDVELRHGTMELARGANLYRGTAILTPHASLQMERTLAREVARLAKPVLLAAFYEGAGVPAAQRNERGFLELRPGFISWSATQTPRPPEPPKDDGRPPTTQVDEWLADTADAVSAWLLPRTAAVRRFYAERPVPEASRTEEWLLAHLDDLLDWYAGAAAGSLREIRLADVLPWHARPFRAELAELKDGVHLVVLRAALLRLERTPCLAQALSGFNEALLMRRQTYQLPVADPLAFADDAAFVRRVRDAVGPETRSSPVPLDDFNPIRAGALDLVRLRLVDSFGQVRDLRWDRVSAAETLAPVDARYPVLLPPRVAQPMRLNLRWLAADSDEEEMSEHPDTSPVCGWVLANHLDGSLVVYGADGDALGSLAADAEEPWRPAPGSGAHPTVESIPSPALRRVVRAMRDHQRAAPMDGTAFLDRFLEVVDSAMDRIEPDHGASQGGRALLVGRPLAVVRVSLGLELQGPPVAHQGWSVFRHDLRRAGRETHRFEHVRFPVRIGEHGQLNDGVVGFWIEDGEGGFADPRFFTPVGEVADGPWISAQGTLPAAHSPSPAGPARTLCLLVDPRGVVHATCGAAPVKSIDIPAHQYQPALRALEVTFLTAPLLTDRGTVRITLPDEPGMGWSWLERRPGGWAEWTTHGVVTLPQVVGELGDRGAAVWRRLLEKGWTTRIDGERAAVVSPDRRTGATLGDDMAAEAVRVEALFARLQVTPFQTGAVFSGPQELREGWLKLRDESPDTVHP